ncbi:MAG: hypothetical protein AB1393_09015 [Candidatus Edwardsbacteria bacterium]
MNEIVDDKYLIENLNLTKAFINHHARAMGSFSRPRKFFLKNVMAHLAYLAEKSMQKSRATIINKAAFKDRIDREIEEVRARIEARKNR